MVNLNPDAMRVLQELSKTFVQSCFNSKSIPAALTGRSAHSLSAFFKSILQDIRMERSKVRPKDNLRCFFLARFFIEYFLLIRLKEMTKSGEEEGTVPDQANLSLGLVAEMAEMESVRWIVMRMKYTMEDKVSQLTTT